MRIQRGLLRRRREVFQEVFGAIRLRDVLRGGRDAADLNGLLRNHSSCWVLNR